MTKESTSKFTGDGRDVYLVIWTTTPWSLVGNRAVCFKEGASYTLLRCRDNNLYIVAKDLLSRSEDVKLIFQDAQVIRDVTTEDLKTVKYHHPLNDDEICPVLPGDHVTLDSGTGLVHTAPSHGREDFVVGLDHELDLSCPVDENGCYLSNLRPDIANLPVLKEGTEKMLTLLAQNILHQSEFVHSYPYDWRTKTPVIQRASEQWFLDVDSLRQSAQKALEDVVFQPALARDRLEAVIKKRPYWCISRQRAWGVPIPALIHKESKEVVITQDLVDSFCKHIDEHGTDFWWKLDDRELCQASGLNPMEYERVQDILDVWFDSGVAWSAGQEEGVDITTPSDLYLEGLDQFSGWFYTSLMTKMAIYGTAPFKLIFAHGFTLDQNGNKMSKSLGNVVSPTSITQGSKKDKLVLGVDGLRVWVAGHATQHANILAGPGVFKEAKADLDNLRLVLRFILGVTSEEIRSDSDLLAYEELRALDKYLLHCLSEFLRDVTDCYDDLKYHTVMVKINNFRAFVSSFYIHRVRDILYCDAKTSKRRRSTITTLWHLLRGLNYSSASIAPVLSWELSQVQPLLKDIFQVDHCWPENWNNSDVSKNFKAIQDIYKTVVEQVQVDELKSKELMFASLPLEVKEAVNLLGPDELQEFFQVAQVSGHGTCEVGSVQFELCETQGHHCQRCRLMTSSKPDELCKRCHDVVESLNH